MSGCEEDACFAPGIVRWLGLRRDGDFDSEGARTYRVGIRGFIDGGKEAGSVVDAIGVRSYFLACFWCCSCCFRLRRFFSVRRSS